MTFSQNFLIFSKKRLTNQIRRDIIYIVDCERHNLGVAQLVARYLGVVEAVGSSPVTQTMQPGAARMNRIPESRDAICFSSL